METSGGYWAACALHAGLKLSVFDALGEDRLTAREVSARIGADERGGTALLNALSAMDLLRKEGERFSNTSASSDLLRSGSPHYLGHILLHHHHLMARWARLPEAVRTGRPVATASSHTQDEAEQEAFLMGMFNIASGMAPKVVKAVDLSGRRRLLDLGGGPGTYAIHFCLENPDLSAVIFDLAGTRPFAEKTVARFGLSDRVELRRGRFSRRPPPRRIRRRLAVADPARGGPRGLRAPRGEGREGPRPRGAPPHPRVPPGGFHGPAPPSRPLLAQHARGDRAGAVLLGGPGAHHDGRRRGGATSGASTSPLPPPPPSSRERCRAVTGQMGEWNWELGIGNWELRIGEFGKPPAQRAGSFRRLRSFRSFLAHLLTYSPTHLLTYSLPPTLA